MEILTVKDFLYHGKGFASYELREQLREKELLENDYIMSFAYTDYGGDFMDKVLIEYFIEKKPLSIFWENTIYYGKNAVIFGQVARDFIKASENYLLGYENTEDYYSQKSNDVQEAEAKRFLNEYRKDGEELTEKQKADCFLIICDKLSEYSILPSGSIDICESTLEKTLEDFLQGIINLFYLNNRNC